MGKQRLISLFRTNLKVQVAFGVALPVLLVLLTTTAYHSWRNWQLIQTQLESAAVQIGELTLNSLRYAMEVNDFKLAGQVLTDVSQGEDIQQIQIVDMNGTVKIHSAVGETNQIHIVNDPDCQGCHINQGNGLPESTWVQTDKQVIRVAYPIHNEPICGTCHITDNQHLGILLIDINMGKRVSQLQTDFQNELGLSIITTLVVTGLVYWLITRLVVNRVESFRKPLETLAEGDFSVRLPVSDDEPVDEIGALAKGFNHLAADLEKLIQEQRKRTEVRQQAIIEERERIAREMHDGLAQVLGYVNTKAIAIRMLLKKNRLEAAETNLQQLEEAARELFIDVRETILGLRINGTGKLTPALDAYIAQFSRLSGIQVNLVMEENIQEFFPITPETELQLLRIVQEALTNIRKHSQSNQATIELKHQNNHLMLSVSDNGVGFRPNQRRISQRPHFGLTMMRERAEAIGAIFDINSKPGQGTRVDIRLEKNHQTAVLMENQPLPPAQNINGQGEK